MFVIPTPYYLTSALNALKKPAVPNFAAVYMVLNPVPINPETEMILRIYAPLDYAISVLINPLVIAI
jgi:hypothetical protein